MPGPATRFKVSGWEEWELDGGMKITSSLGWFDAEDYERQVCRIRCGRRGGAGLFRHSGRFRAAAPFSPGCAASAG